MLGKKGGGGAPGPAADPGHYSRRTDVHQVRPVSGRCYFCLLFEPASIASCWPFPVLMAILCGLARSAFGSMMRTMPFSKEASALPASTSNGSVTLRRNCPCHSSCRYQVAPLPCSLSAAVGTVPERVTTFWL